MVFQPGEVYAVQDLEKNFEKKCIRIFFGGSPTESLISTDME